MECKDVGIRRGALEESMHRNTKGEALIWNRSLGNAAGYFPISGRERLEMKPVSCRIGRIMVGKDAGFVRQLRHGRAVALPSALVVSNAIVSGEWGRRYNSEGRNATG